MVLKKIPIREPAFKDAPRIMEMLKLILIEAAYLRQECSQTVKYNDNPEDFLTESQWQTLLNYPCVIHSFTSILDCCVCYTMVFLRPPYAGGVRVVSHKTLVL